jgi:ubiquinone/menaquinone biosynthesis C-methylase UbiE
VAATRWIDWILGGPIRHLLEKPERMLKAYVGPGMTVLDVGCGAGYHSLGMAALVGSNGRVVSVDTQPQNVETLKQKAARAGLLGRIEPRLCGHLDLAIDDLDGQVDFALAVYVVHHAAEANRLMSNVHRALKPGGIFMVVEPRHHSSASECDATETAARDAGFAVAGHPRLRRDWAVTFVKG